MRRLARWGLIALFATAPLLLGRCDQRAVITVAVDGLGENRDLTTLNLVASIAGRRLHVRLPAQAESRIALLPDASGALTVEVTAQRADDCAVATGQAEAQVSGADSLRVQVHLVRKLCNEACFCWENPLPMGNTLRRVWGSSTSDIWAVGAVGTVRHWNGRTWEPPTPPVTSDSLFALWGGGPSAVWAAGAATIIHYNGLSWETQRLPRDAEIADLWGSGDDDVWAVGSMVLHLESGGWMATTLPALPADIKPMTGENFAAISGSGLDDIWVVGSYTDNSRDGGAYRGSLLHRKAGVWTREPSPPPPTGASQTIHKRVWVNSSSDVWLASVHFIPDPDPKKGGTYPMTIQRRRAGMMTWETLPIPSGGSVRRIGGRPGGEPWLVGGDKKDSVPFIEIDPGRGVLWHWQAGGWQRQDGATQAQDALNDIWVSPQDDLWAVGDNAAVLTRRALDWTVAPQGSTRELYALWASGADAIWAVGAAGTLLRWDGATWSAIASPVRGDNVTLRDVIGLRADDLWAVGYDSDASRGVVLRGDGQTWRSDAAVQSSALANVQLAAIWGRSEDDLWSVGTGSRDGSLAILHRGAVAWGAEPAAAQLGLSALSASGVWGVDDAVIVAASKGDRLTSQSVLLRRDPSGTWGIEETLNRMLLDRLRGGRDGALWAVGRRYDPQQVDKDNNPMTLGAAVQRIPMAAGKAAWKDLSAGLAQHKDLSLTDVNASGPDEVWASGHVPDDTFAGCSSNHRGVMLRRSGGRWELLPSGAATTLNSVAAARSGEIWVGGGGGTILHRRIVAAPSPAPSDGSVGPPP